MKKSLLALSALSILGATVAATPALAGDRDRVSRGEIRFIPDVAGIPAAAAVVHIDGTYGAVDGKRIIGGAVTQVRAQLRLDGQNMVNGETVEADVLDCTLGTSDGFDFLGSDFSAIKLSGKITGGYRIDFPQRSGD